MAGGRGALLHQIFQRTGVAPDEVIAKPRLARTFIFKSMEVQLEAEAAAAEARRQRK